MRKGAIIACVSAVLAVVAAGDIVYMKDGKIHRGVATREGDRVLIKGPIATIAVDAKDVQEIIKSEKSGTTNVERPVGPTVTLETPETGPDAYTRPESHVFLAMRQLEGAPVGMGAGDLREKIRKWQEKTHDRERKGVGKWYGPKDSERARKEFVAKLAETKDVVTEIRRAGSATASGRATQARLRRTLAVTFREAAQAWPDPLMRNFLMGAAHLEGLNYTGALQMFEKCIAAAPRVAAFRQGKVLALAGKKLPIETLTAAVELLHLQPDSREAFEIVQRAMQDTPGNLMTDTTYVTAKEIISLYEPPTNRAYSRPGITWLMPGRPWMGQEFKLPTPPYDRLVFRQAVGMPVGKHALLVDRRSLAGELEVFVRVAPNIIVPGKVQRTSMWGMNKEAAILGMVVVKDVEFTPLTADGTAKAAKGQNVKAFGLGIYEEMGSDIRPIEATVKSVGADGDVALTRGLVPGETASAVITKDGQILGFLAGKADPMVDSGGPDQFLPVSLFANLVRQATMVRSFIGGYGLKRKVVPKPAPGQAFVVLVTSSEAPDTRRL